LYSFLVFSDTLSGGVILFHPFKGKFAAGFQAMDEDFWGS
jgi:hypothetical protein